MKKTISILLALALVLCMGTMTVFAAGAGDAQINLSADVSSAKVGDIVTVTVSGIPDSAVGLGALDFEIVYDTAAFEFVADSFKSAGFFSASSLTPQSGKLAYSATQEAAVTAAGTVATAQFKVLKTNASITLNLTSVGLGDFDSTDTTAAVVANSTTSVTIACDHAYGEWTVKTASTCQVAGEEVRVCSACGVEESRKAALADHTPGAWEVVKEATCTEDGERVQKCTDCKAVIANETISANGHIVDDWTITVEPGCETTGEQTGICTICGETDTVTIPILSHNIDEWKVEKEATCTEEGSKIGTCTHCEKTVTEAIPALGHDFGEWKVVKEATETEVGSKERVCKTCGEKETVEIDKLAPTVTTDSKVPDIPKTSGAVAGSIAAFAMLSMAAGVAAVTMKKKHEDD